MLHTLWQWMVLTWNVPNGGIWSNLFAEPVVAIFVALGSSRILKTMRKHHQEKISQTERHHHEQMQKLHAIHDHLKSNGG